jgi:hypothetical protein
MSLSRILRRTAGLAEDAADVQQADAAHFQQVLQQLGAAALDGGLVDAVQVHRVVGHQAVAARDQLQAQLALAQARFAGDHHAQAQDVHEHAVHRGTVGESAWTDRRAARRSESR